MQIPKLLTHVQSILYKAARLELILNIFRAVYVKFLKAK